MKIYKLNSLTTLFFALAILGFVVFLPIVLIEALWNSTIGRTYPDVTIDFWQALILWLVVLVSLNIVGLFKFEFAMETMGNLDKESLKKKIEGLKNNVQSKIEERPTVEPNVTKENKE